MRFLKNVGLVSIAELIAGFLAFLYTLIAARILGLTDYGLFQSVMGIYGALAILTFPLNLAAIHCINKSREEDKLAAVGELIKLAFWIGIICLLAFIVLSPLLTKLLHTTSFLLIILIGKFIAVTAVLTSIYGVLQGQHRYAQFSVTRIIQASSILIIGTPLMLLGWGPSGTILGYTLSMLGISMFFLFQQKLFVFRKNGFSLIRKELLSITKIALVFGALSLIDSLPMITARIRLDNNLSSIYGALYNLRNIIWPFAFAVTIPFYSQTLSDSEEKNVLGKALLLMFVLGGGFIGISLFFKELVFDTLYGKSFVQAAKFMPLYGVSLLMQMLMMVLMFHNIAKNTLRMTHLTIPLLCLMAGLIIKGTHIQGLIEIQIIVAAVYFVIIAVRKIKLSFLR